MKLLFVDTSPKPCAKTARLSLLTGALAKMGEDVSCFCSRPELMDPAAYVVTETLEWEGFFDVMCSEAGIYKTEKSGLFSASLGSRFAKKLKKPFLDFLKSRNPDVVFLNGYSLPYVPFGQWCKKIGVPYAIFADRIRTLENTEESVLADAAKVLVPSRAMMAYLDSFVPDRIYHNYETVFSPLHPMWLEGQKDSVLRFSFGADEKTPVLLYPGPITPFGGQKEAIRAMRDVHAAVPDALLWIEGVGEKPLMDELRVQASTHKVYKAVKFIGRGANMPGLLALADLVIHGPINDDPEKGPVDSSGKIVAQSMAAGTPVVATDCAAASEPLMGTAAGAIVAPGATKDLAKAVTVFLTNSDVYENAVRACKNRAQNAFTAEAVATRILTLAKEIKGKA